MSNRILIRKYPFPSAGHFIYNGYANAFKSLGYDVERWDVDGNKLVRHKKIDHLLDEKDYILMATDHDLSTMNTFGLLDQVISNSRKIVCFVSGNWMPSPFGIRGCYTTVFSDSVIEKLNKEDKVLFWSFGEKKDKWGHDFTPKFKSVLILPLAFDNFTYLPIEDKNWEYDVCFVGQFVDNGVAFKETHIKEWIMSLENMGLKCGFFGMLDRKISQEDESKLLYNSKISLNVHDQYQHLIGTDFNEREVKSIGSNGFLITDRVRQSEIYNLPAIRCDSSHQYHAEIFNKLNKDLSNTKKENRQFILDKHSYTERVKKLLEYL